MIRALIDEVVLLPNDDKRALIVNLYGDLAGIPAIADRKEKSSMRSECNLASSEAILQVVELDEDSSKQLFEILADWNQQLTAENIDVSELST
ncbi:MAG: hypothetical protein AAGH38_00025 [Pseudomonadota bacterium]